MMDVVMRDLNRHLHEIDLWEEAQEMIERGEIPCQDCERACNNLCPFWEVKEENNERTD